MRPRHFFQFIFVAFIIATLQIGYASEGFVQTKDRITIEQPKSSGEWKGRDLSVKYDYAINNGQMSISGRIEFGNSMRMGYSELRQFRLSLVFADGNGNVAGRAPLAVKATLDSSDFKDDIAVPPSTKVMAFQYDGVAIGMDGGIPLLFGMIQFIDVFHGLNHGGAYG